MEKGLRLRKLTQVFGRTFSGIIAIGVVIVISLSGCVSAPEPIGDSSKAGDVLAGKSFEAFYPPFFKSHVTFNFNGTAASVTSNILGKTLSRDSGAYSVSGTSGSIEFGKKYTIELNSATDPTQLVMDGHTFKKVTAKAGSPNAKTLYGDWVSANGTTLKFEEREATTVATDANSGRKSNATIIFSVVTFSNAKTTLTKAYNWNGKILRLNPGEWDSGKAGITIDLDCSLDAEKTGLIISGFEANYVKQQLGEGDYSIFNGEYSRK